jgi:hypothetical protein
MGTTMELEKLIKKNQEVIGGVLLGMHQDLQNQQKTVDEKIEIWATTFADTEAKLTDNLSNIDAKKTEFHSYASEIMNNINEKMDCMHDEVDELTKTIRNNVEKIDLTVTQSIEKLEKNSSDKLEIINQWLNEFLSDAHSKIDEFEKNVAVQFKQLNNQIQKENDEFKKTLEQLSSENQNIKNKLKQFAEYSSEQHKIFEQKISESQEYMRLSQDTILARFNEMANKNHWIIWMNGLTIGLASALLFLVLK